MSKNIFNTTNCSSRLELMAVGDSGFILINPKPLSIESSFLSDENMFVLHVNLILFPTDEHVERFLKITQAYSLFRVGIKRVGTGLTENDFEINLTIDKNFNDTYFSPLQNIESEYFIKNPKYICFENVSVHENNVGLDSYLDKLEEDYAEPTPDYEAMELEDLYEIKKNALEENDFEFISELDEIIKKKESGGTAA